MKNRKKKIVIFVPEFPVLTETFIERDTSKLIDNGKLDIVVLAMKRGAGVVSDSIKKHFVEARLSPIDCITAAFFFILKPKKIYKAFKLVMQDKSRSVFGRKYLFLKTVGYARIFQKYHPDEIHAHFLSDPSTIAMAASIILNVPFSINAHARDVTEYPTLLSEKIKKAKFITVCNSNAYDTIISVADDLKDKIKLIRHGVDEHEIFSTPLRLKKANRPMIISGGTRLVEKKGLKYLIEASKRLVDRGVNHEIHITGPGDLYNILTALIKEKDLEDIVFVHGEGKGVPFSEISQYYRIADILVLPSIKLDSGDVDGIPNSLIEASLARLPIITTDVGSIAELISNDINGVIVPQKNFEAIAAEIERLIFDKARGKRLGENAYIKAKEMFNGERNINKLVDLMLK